MANIDQVKSQIRFELDKLSTRNAHHDFEHLCRHLTRARICSNILPATGPVSAGGDLGRDFETFRTFLTSSSISGSTFIGLTSNKPIAFACSIQKEIHNKIKSDVQTIMGSGSAVEAIYYFCVTDIPIPKRHELQAWAKENFSIELEIHDGQSISELLSDREVFWIAERYLSIPAEIYPVTLLDDGNQWYSKSLEVWKKRNSPSFNYADFVELKTAARHALYTAEMRQNLPFWISQLEKFIGSDSLEGLKRRAIYEVIVLSHRGLGTLLGQETRLREYFDTIPTLEEPVELENVAVLLNYCVGAQLGNSLQLTADEINQWRNKLKTRVEERLNAVTLSSSKCSLLDILGHISLSKHFPHLSKPNVDEAFESWLKLTVLVKDAPLFPLEGFADHLTKFTRFIGDHEKYSLLTQRVDSLLAERHGEFIAAEKCRDRAMEFYNSGKIVRAINELHQAKIKWFAEEALRGSLLAMLCISQWYLELGLSLAAKYYALAAAYIALHSEKEDIKPYLPKALIFAAHCDYHQGAWCGFFELANIGLRAHFLVSKDPGNFEMHRELQEILYHSTVAIIISERLDSELHSFAVDVTKKWKMDDLFNEYLESASNAWKEKNISELWNSLEEQLGGRPFGDVGANREAIWSELGITWKVNWKDDFDTTPLAEQFVAVLQILLADISKVDLCLLKTEVQIMFAAEDIGKPLIEPIPSNTDRKWRIVLPLAHTKTNSEMKDLQIEILAAVSIILLDISLATKEFIDKALENSFKEGISMKVFVGDLYETLYRQFISRGIFDSSNRAAKKLPLPERYFKVSSHKELDWNDSRGLGYNPDEVRKHLEHRYSRFLIPIKYTLPRLLQFPEFKATVARLRADGWLDWHILAAITNIVINIRAKQLLGKYPDVSVKERIGVQKALTQEIMNTPEEETSPQISLSEFTEEKLRMSLNMSMSSTLKVLGLECRQMTPDLGAIAHFLGKRYNYWTDDIEHPDFFSAE